MKNKILEDHGGWVLVDISTPKFPDATMKVDKDMVCRLKNKVTLSESGYPIMHNGKYYKETLSVVLFGGGRMRHNHGKTDLRRESLEEIDTIPLRGLSMPELRKNHPEEWKRLRARQRIAEKKYEKKESYRKIKNKQQNKRNQVNPEKVKATSAIKYAIRTGRIKKPSACEVCGSVPKKLNGHHEDYSKPLCVVWMCQACHSGVHSKQKGKL